MAGRHITCYLGCSGISRYFNLQRQLWVGTHRSVVPLKALPTSGSLWFQERRGGGSLSVAPSASPAELRLLC